MTEAAAAVTTTAEAAATTTTAAATTAANAPWHGYTAPEDVAYVTNKGWQGPQDALRSYRDAEKLIGRDPSTLLVMPRADDPAGFLSVMDKLGRPADPSKYEFELAQGADANNPFLGWARGTFHKLGLPASMAKALVKEYDAFATGHATQTTKDYETRVAADKLALKNEWKDGAEKMLSLAGNAAKALGFSGEMIDAMEAQVGYAATMKHFAELGQKMGEDAFVTGGDKNAAFGNAMTPGQAKAEWDAAKLDPAFTAALMDKSHPGHSAAQEKQTRLFRVMYPEG